MDGVNETNVVRWFDEHVPAAKGPLTFSFVSGGRSNLTYKVTDQQRTDFVLRRPPLGHVLETAHDMGREYRIISALAGRIPVAKTHGLCTDKTVNDAPFYVMDFVPGIVLHDEAAAGNVDRGDRHALGMHIIEVLATLHNLNPDEVGLGDLGRKEAYVARQLKRWSKQYDDTKTDDLPEMDECRRLLGEMPEQVGAGIVHGDYRPGNFMVLGHKVSAVLDWELCTLGDTLADVGYLMNMWSDPGDPAADRAPVAVGGFPTRAEMCDRYVAMTGRDLAKINYYRAFSHWRLACISQGVYKRYLVGAMGKQEIDLSAYKATIIGRARKALALLAG